MLLLKSGPSLWPPRLGTLSLGPIALREAGRRVVRTLGRPVEGPVGQGPEPPTSSPVSESVSGFSSLQGPQPLLTVRTLVRL